jgi:aryl-alcohol dehydrogenase (NADP+)
MARGRLARPWGEVTDRTNGDEFGKSLYNATDDANPAINAAVAEIAKARGVAMAQVALAWVLQKKPVAAPIIGATKLNHVADAVAAVELVLTADEVAKLEAPYRPTGFPGFR